MVGRPSTPVGTDPSAQLGAAGPTVPSLLEMALFVVPFVPPFVAAVYLGFRLRRRAA